MSLAIGLENPTDQADVLVGSGTKFTTELKIGYQINFIDDTGSSVTRIIQKGYYTIDSSSVTAYTAVAGDQILANPTANPITVTLPASPATGDEVSFLDARGTFASNNLIVDRNGQPINTGTSNLTLNTAGQSFTLVYVDSTRGWAYKTNTA